MGHWWYLNRDKVRVGMRPIGRVPIERGRKAEVERKAGKTRKGLAGR